MLAKCGVAGILGRVLSGDKGLGVASVVTVRTKSDLFLATLLSGVTKNVSPGSNIM